MVVELVGGTTIARTIIERALRAGKHVVTANKALLAHHGRGAVRAGSRHGVCIAFEASCAGGMPIIRALTGGLVANRIDALYGIVNGTCNYILTAMTQRGPELSPTPWPAAQKARAWPRPTRRWTSNGHGLGPQAGDPGVAGLRPDGSTSTPSASTASTRWSCATSSTARSWATRSSCWPSPTPGRRPEPAGQPGLHPRRRTRWRGCPGSFNAVSVLRPRHRAHDVLRARRRRHAHGVGRRGRPGQPWRMGDLPGGVREPEDLAGPATRRPCNCPSTRSAAATTSA